MAEQTRVWRIDSQTESLQELPRRRLNFEDRLETWLAHDIALVRKDAMVISRQQATAHGGQIDLVCLDRSGDLVVIELKRDKTPREVTAQALDYASWVSELSALDVQTLADTYLGAHGPLADAYERQFEEPLPEKLNENHQILIVASDIDAHSERIIKYLSGHHGVNINAVTFTFYELDGVEYLARNYLIEPDEVLINENRRSQSKRPPPLTVEQLTEVAATKGVEGLFRQSVDRIGHAFDATATTRSTVAFIGVMEGRRNTIFSLEPYDSNEKDGLRFYFYKDRFFSYFGLPESALKQFTTLDLTEDSKWGPGRIILRGWIDKDSAIDELERLTKSK